MRSVFFFEERLFRVREVYDAKKKRERGFGDLLYKVYNCFIWLHYILFSYYIVLDFLSACSLFLICLYCSIKVDYDFFPCGLLVAKKLVIPIYTTSHALAGFTTHPTMW